MVLNHVLKLQKDRRDKLANVFRENKNRYARIEQEITILTDNINAQAEMERLDSEILQLQNGCKSLNNQIETLRNGINMESQCHQRQTSQQQPSPQQTQQSFPNRPTRVSTQQSSPSSTTSSSPHFLRSQQSQQELGFVQHHLTTPQRVSPNTSPQPPVGAGGHWSPPQLSHNASSSSLHSPAYQNQMQHHIPTQASQLQQQHNSTLEDEEYTSDDYDDEVDPQEMWSCNMCTFRNHPQLNICEQCENVRIKPGTIRIVRAESGGEMGAAAAPPSSSNVSLEHDGSPNLTQQQQLLQQFALHT